ncbi:MAG: class I SAM-dependent methyltransferase [bacterium]
MQSDEILFDKKALDKQRPHWEKALSNRPDMFGTELTTPGKRAVERFKKEGKTHILELGAGQGRDTFYFAQNGFHVHVLDYSESGIKTINQTAEALGLSDLITTQVHDVRTPFPLDDDAFDACYSHMLYCMPLRLLNSNSFRGKSCAY